MNNKYCLQYNAIQNSIRLLTRPTSRMNQRRCYNVLNEEVVTVVINIKRIEMQHGRYKPVNTVQLVCIVRRLYNYGLS